MYKEKIKTIIQNQRRWEKAIKEHQDTVKHNIMLKQELRKLREKDIMTIKERNKRRDMIKKNKIIEKQLLKKNLVLSSKQELELYKKKIIEDDVKDTIEKNYLASTLLNVTKSTQDPLKRNKILKSSRLNLCISQSLLSPDKKEESEED